MDREHVLGRCRKAHPMPSASSHIYPPECPRTAAVSWMARAHTAAPACHVRLYRAFDGRLASSLGLLLFVALSPRLHDVFGARWRALPPRPRQTPAFLLFAVRWRSDLASRFFRLTHPLRLVE